MKKMKGFYLVVVFVVSVLLLSAVNARAQVLSVPDIVNVLVSFGKGGSWEMVKRGSYDRYNNYSTCDRCGFHNSYAFITRIGNDRIKVPRMIYSDKDSMVVAEKESFNIVKIEGPNVKFIMAESFCGYPPWSNCPEWNRWENEIEHEIEVVSKTHVKVRQIVHDKDSPLRIGVGEYRKR